MEMHRYPMGWLSILLEAVIRHDLYFDIHELTSEETLTDRLLKKATGNTSIKDHWGDSQDKMVFEPYGDHDVEARRFAEYLNVQLVLGEEPEWHPTCRRYEFILREASPPAQGFAELVNCTNWEFRRRCEAQEMARK